MKKQEYFSLFHQAKLEFEGQLAIGESKYSIKHNAELCYENMVRRGEKPDCSKQEFINRALKGKIFAWSSYRGYLKQIRYFLNYCRNEHDCKNLVDCHPFINEYLEKCIDKGESPHTLSTKKCAIAKLYQESSTKYIKTPPRTRAGIKRSRYHTKTDELFSEDNNSDYVEFVRSIGLRKHEIGYVRPNNLQFDDDGTPRLAIKGKGGKWRAAEIIGDTEKIIKRIQVSPQGVFEHTPSHADTHSYRAEYAVGVYEKYARPYTEYCDAKWYNPKTHKYESACYRFRKDMKGKTMDKEAMLTAAKNLGHNRIDIIAYAYAYIK